MPIPTMPEKFQDVQDNTGVDRTVKKKRDFSIITALHDLANDYTDSNPFFTTAGTVGDAAIAAGLIYPPTAPMAASIAGAANTYYNAPKVIYGNDYWKDLGKHHRNVIKNVLTPMPEELRADEMNKFKGDLYKTFIKPKIPY